MKTGSEILSQLIIVLLSFGKKIFEFVGGLFYEIGSAVNEMDWLSLDVDILKSIATGLVDGLELNQRNW